MGTNIKVARVLSNKPFTKDTYDVVHTKSSLKLNTKEKEIVNDNWIRFLQESQSKGSKEWNGTFYRLENISDIISGSKILLLSTITYSHVRALKDHPQLSKKFRANNISTASLIRTTDGYFIFGIKNSNSMSKSRTGLIGGGLQKSELVVNNFSDVFKNEFKEIEEEIGLREKDISSMKGLGILQSNHSTVIFIFFTQLKKSKDEVEKIFSKNTDDEIVLLDFIEEDKLKEYLKDNKDYRELIVELYYKK